MKSITLHMKYRGHKSNVKPHVLEQFSGSIKSMDEANKIPPMACIAINAQSVLPI